MTAKGAFKAL